MSVKPSDEAGSEGGWYGADLENMELFGKKSSSARFEDSEREDEQKQHSHHPPHPVTMETASTDKSDADLLKKSIIDMGDPYTSLLSSYSSQMDTSYFSGDVSGGEKKQQAGIDDLISGLDCQSAMFSSDSGIEMTPSAELGYSSHKLHDSDKTPDSTYNYMDIRSREDPYSQQQLLEDWGISAASESAPLSSLRGGHYLEKSPSPVEVETLGPSAAALDSHTFPYVEEPSDDELSDYQPNRSPGAEDSASPVKITLTETPPLSVSPVANKRASPVAVSEKESILSLGLQGVPTVTLSEPEDESPGSSTPPLTEESDSPSDPMIPTTEVKTQEKAPETFSLVSQTAPKSQSPSLELKSTPTLPLYAKVSDASSGDSGDSEIELVSEEPSPQAPSSAYMTFSKSPSTPPPAPATTQAPVSVSVPAFNPLPGLASAPNSAAMQYSILREEREAELDSELALESCEEESPKRFPQDSSTKVSKVNSQPDEPPPPSATVIAAPPVNPAPPPAAPVSDDAPKEKMASEGEDEKTKPSIKPSPPTAVLPELKVEQPPEERQAERKHSSAEKHPTTPAIFQGITREKAMELLYWRDVKQTGLVFSSVLLLLFSLTQFSVVSVVAYLALAALSATISFRVYKSVLQAVQKTDEGHPFKSYLEIEMSLSNDQMQKYAENTQNYINNTLKELRRLFLVQDLVDSLKFAVVMWLLTYVGALFNGLTLLIMAVVSMFTMPVVYEKYQAQIDQYVGLVRTQVNTVVGKIQEKIPGAKRKAE
ncbi:reticulon-1b isoform X1 [Ictalurus furcatus]|uniref:reticulon-1b isoform X1 n=1 Tax=Ictalurus furcatus TaxID=66913 RepID=UPI0023501E92|nr:reticulon-1b isoform X1 [Ictalurus furcatus]